MGKWKRDRAALVQLEQDRLTKAVESQLPDTSVQSILKRAESALDTLDRALQRDLERMMEHQQSSLQRCLVPGFSYIGRDPDRVAFMQKLLTLMLWME